MAGVADLHFKGGEIKDSEERGKHVQLYTYMKVGCPNEMFQTSQGSGSYLYCSPNTLSRADGGRSRSAVIECRMNLNK